MYRLASCIFFDHDIRLVAVAVAVCAMGTLVMARLLHRAMLSARRARYAWIFIGALAAGSTIWCTHFVAMLAYEPGMPITYDPAITLVSLILAMVGCAAAFAIASERVRYAREIGGATFGVAITLMHYTGMAAFATNGTLEWDPTYLVVSVFFSVVFGVLAFRSVGRNLDLAWPLTGASLLAFAIVGLHFSGMAAITILPFPAGADDILVDMARPLLALAVTGVGLVIVSTGAISHFLDDEARAQANSQMRLLTASAVDGMVVERNGTIVETNAEFERLTGKSRAALLGTSVARFFQSPEVLDGDGGLVLTKLLPVEAAPVSVELAVRTEPSTRHHDPLTIYSIRDISQRIAQDQKISFLAHFDSLTGLRNRASFLEKTTHILRMNPAGTRLAVLAVDLDRFKEVNDLYGHAAGDEVLRAVGKRLKAGLGATQIGARLGGDEFVAFAPVASQEEAVEFAERIQRTLSAEIRYEGSVLQCEASIGVAMFPEDGAEMNTLLNNADLAMYRAKLSDGERVCLYDTKMDDAIRDRRKLIDELRLGVLRREFELYYQKQVHVGTGEVAGYEALVRWNHPERGVVGPERFIPLAEQTGLIVKLGNWIIRRACEDATCWDNPISVAINLSPAQLGAPDFVDTLKEILHDTGIVPSRIEFEVTETCFVAEDVRIARKLEEIKALGVAISIDDFGTGYSSLAMLHTFPFDKIKLDRSLISDIQVNAAARSIFRTVLSLGEALAVSVVAEGIETSEQRDYIRSTTCQFAQGFYYGLPEPLHLSSCIELDRKDGGGSGAAIA